MSIPRAAGWPTGGAAHNGGGLGPLPCRPRRAQRFEARMRLERSSRQRVRHVAGAGADRPRIVAEALPPVR